MANDVFPFVGTFLIGLDLIPSFSSPLSLTYHWNTLYMILQDSKLLTYKSISSLALLPMAKAII
jgi:hypothetical protein